MAEWIEPIYDRTTADVTRAKLQVQEWIQAMARGETVTIEDLKGFLNVSDLNRIEKDTEYLSLSSSLELSIKTDWERNDLPKITDIERIIKNINELITEFEVKEFTYEMPDTLLAYNQVNIIEHNLRIIKTLVDDIENQIKAEFSLVVLELESKISLPLIIQVKPDTYVSDYASNIILNDTRVISIYSLFDLTISDLSSKIIDCIVLPIKVEFENIAYQNIKVVDLKSIPIKEKFNQFVGTMSCSIIPSKSEPINTSLSLNSLYLNCECLSITSLNIKAEIPPSVTNISTEVNVLEGLGIVPSKEIISEIFQLVLDFGFADISMISSFSKVEFIIDSKLNEIVPNLVKLDTNAITNTNINVALYRASKLIDYETNRLSLMDIKTLKDLSYTEI